MTQKPNECGLCVEDGGMLIWRNQALRVVYVQEPDLPGYTRIMWQHHVAEMSDLKAADQQLLMQAVFVVESVQRRILAADKVNLASLGNMTPHLHWHVIPRWKDDPWFPDSIWAPQRERDSDSQASWKERHEALAALQGEYTMALKVSLQHTFGNGNSEPAASPAPSSVPSSNRLQELPSRQLARLHPGWRAALDTPAVQDAIARLDEFLAQRLQDGAVIFPARIFRALEELAPEDVRVVILGQDPYHGPGQAQGLAFSVPDGCPTPPSLRNIFNELAQEYPDMPRRRRTDLSDWSHQGVLLLNTSLTVEQGAAGSHARKGWEIVTDALIDTVAATAQPKVFLLWGSHAQSKQTSIREKGQAYTIFMANHPSPLSASRPPRPFIGCRHFSQANAWLSAQGVQPIQWVSHAAMTG